MIQQTIRVGLLTTFSASFLVLSGCATIQHHSYTADVSAGELNSKATTETASKGDLIVFQSFSPQKVVKINSDAISKSLYGPKKLLDAGTELYQVSSQTTIGALYCEFGKEKKTTECLLDADQDGLFERNPTTSPEARTFFIGGGEFIGKGWSLTEPLAYENIDLRDDHSQTIGVQYNWGGSKAHFKLVMESLHDGRLFGKTQFTQLGKDTVKLKSSESLPKDITVGDYTFRLMSIDESTKGITYQILSGLTAGEKVSLTQKISQNFVTY